MKPKKINHDNGDLFRSRLSNQINLSHELVQLSAMIDWEGLDSHFSKLFFPVGGQPPKPVRLIVGLLILQQTYGRSDEEVIDRWVENPYWQYFCGYDFLQTEFPVHPTSLTRWRVLDPELLWTAALLPKCLNLHKFFYTTHLV